jgi:hypothetical protein
MQPDSFCWELYNDYLYNFGEFDPTPRVSASEVILDTFLISIYKHGLPVNCCEDNFNNLFSNWHGDYIQNADTTKLISFEYVDSISNKEKLDKYIDWINSPTRTITWRMSHVIEMRRDSIAELRTVTSVDFQPNGSMPPYMYRVQEYLSLLFRRTFEKILPGARVYKISFQYKKQDLYIYVFCNPTTYEIIKDDVFDIKIMPSKDNIRQTEIKPL